MAHWAEIDSNNIVTRVLVGDNNDPAGDEGYSWLINNLGGTWIKTSYNTINGEHRNGGTPLRFNYAGIGMFYDKDEDVFYLPQPYPSWTLNKDNYTWVAPIEYPNDGLIYNWNEDNKSWNLFKAENTSSPFPSWTLNTNNIWEAPVKYPNDENAYNWDENSKNWIKL